MEWDQTPNQQYGGGLGTRGYNLTQVTQGAITANTRTTATVTGVTWNTGDSYRLTKTNSYYLTQTGILVDGDTLYVCGRNVAQPPGTPIPPVGILASYDIAGAFKQNPDHLQTIRPPSMNPIPTISGFSGNEWYQGMAIWGNYLCVASQLNGLVIYDVTAPSNMLRHGQYGKTELEANFPTHVADGLYWEASRIAIITYANGARLGETWAFLANHGNGTMAVNISAPAAPTNAQWFDAATENPYGTSTQLRTRNLVAEYVNGEYYLFECNNNNPDSVDSNARGLIVRKVTDPTSAAPDSYYYTPMAAADVDTWIDAGDKPILGIFKHRDWVYLANGQRGLACYDVTDPENAVYVGLLTSAMGTGISLYASLIATIGDKAYAYYGSGASSPQSNKLFSDRVLGGPVAAFTIGTYDNSTVAGGTLIGTNPLSQDLATKRASVAVDNVHTVGVRALQAAGARTLNVGLYTVVAGVRSTLVFTSGNIVIGAGSSWGNYEVAVDWDLIPGVEYITAVVNQSVSVTLASSGSSIASRRDNVAAATFGATWTGSAAFLNTHAYALGENTATATSPSLTAPYTPLSSDIGDAVNIPSNFSGATSYAAQDLPDGCSINPTTGTITGTIASPISGVPTVIAYNEFTTGVLAAIPWTVDYPFVSSVKVDTGALTIDDVPIATPTNMLFLSRFGLLSTRVNGPSVGAVSTSGNSLVVNGVTITSPSVLYLSPTGVLTDVPNNGPVANFIIN
jgi:hypothetical protein